MQRTGSSVTHCMSYRNSSSTCILHQECRRMFKPLPNKAGPCYSAIKDKGTHNHTEDNYARTKTTGAGDANATSPFRCAVSSRTTPACPCQCQCRPEGGAERRRLQHIACCLVNSTRRLNV